MRERETRERARATTYLSIEVAVVELDPLLKHRTHSEADSKRAVQALRGMEALPQLEE